MLIYIYDFVNDTIDLHIVKFNKKTEIYDLKKKKLSIHLMAKLQSIL